MLHCAADQYELSPEGVERLSPLFDGVGARSLVGKRCLDWTERRFHVGGPLGVQLTHALLEKLWLRRLTGSRALAVTPAGERGFRALFGVDIQRGVSVCTDFGPL